MMRILATAAACVLALAAACGKTTDDPSDDIVDANATLSISPPLSEITIAPLMPGTVVFTATATYPDGSTRDVTAEVGFYVDGNYGTFSAATATIGNAGKAPVSASWIYDPDESPKFADAQIIARMKSTRIDPALDSNTPTLFDTLPESLSAAPTLVYPPANVVMPRNLGDFEAHWTDANGYDVFELSLHTEFVDIRTYIPGGNGLAFAGPMPTWAAFLASEWMAAVGTEKQLQYQVRGLTAANPTVVGATSPQLVRLSNENMEGGLYYWGIYPPAAPGGPQISGVWRHDMAKPGELAEEFMSTSTEGQCIACHALSRDGSKMAITYAGGNGAATLVDVATRTPMPSVGNWNFGTFTPNNAEIIGSFGGVLTVRNTLDMSPTMNVPTGGYATHPDMSADGQHLVYVQATSAGADWVFTTGQIAVIDYDQTTHTFGAPRILVTGGGNNYYPSWSPDGQWILFNRSDSDAYDDTNASLWVVKADGSAPPIELVTANTQLGLTNSWGRWAPFAQSVGTGFDPIMWITVSSKRNFGVRLNALPQNYPQVWMMPFSPAVAEQGLDPTSPAFRLPFQDIASKNHIAQWAERIIVTQ